MQLTSGTPHFNQLDKAFLRRAQKEDKEKEGLFDKVMAPQQMAQKQDTQNMDIPKEDPIRDPIMIPKRNSHAGLNAYADIVRALDHNFNQGLLERTVDTKL